MKLKRTPAIISFVFCSAILNSCTNANTDTARGNHNKIILNDTKVSEDYFFEYIENLDKRLKVTCDIYDRDSSNYIHGTFLPKLKNKMKSNDALKKLIEIEIVQE